MLGMVAMVLGRGPPSAMLSPIGAFFVIVNGLGNDGHGGATALPAVAGAVLGAVAIKLMAKALRGGQDEAAGRPRRAIFRDVADGLRYVLGHPVLRNISAMMAIINLVGSSVYAQLVLFAKDRLDATDTQVGLLYSAGSIGVVALSLLAGPLRKRWPFSKVALSALVLDGLMTVALSFTRWYWLALPLWALNSGLGILFNINTGSLRQQIVPNEMLGRVISIAGVLAWSAIPVGTILGGLAIERTGNVALIFGIIGALVMVVALAFSLGPIGHAERYLEPEAERQPAA
jgi:hypothetical protein